MRGADRIIKWSTAGAVLGVAAVAAVASYEHAYDLVRAHGESGWTARMVPLTVDGLIYASSMVMLDSARRKAPVPALARWLLGLGIAATPSGERGPRPGARACRCGGGRVAGGRAGRLLRAAHDGDPRFSGGTGRQCRYSAGGPDPLGEQAAEIFAGQLAAESCSFNPRDPRAAPCGPAPRTAATGVPRYGGCKAGGNSRCMSKRRDASRSCRRKSDR